MKCYALGWKMYSQRLVITNYVGCYLHRQLSSAGDHDGHFWGKSQLNIVGKRSVTEELQSF